MRFRLPGLLAVAAALLAGPGLAAAASATRLVIGPAHPHVRSAVRIGFVQPQVAVGTLPTQSTETLGVTGPARAGCASSAARSVDGAAAGTMLSETLRPSGSDGGRWCVGAYRATLVLSRTSGCPIGVQKRICPQFVIAPTVLATARFRITAG